MCWSGQLLAFLCSRFQSEYSAWDEEREREGGKKGGEKREEGEREGGGEKEKGRREGRRGREKREEGEREGEEGGGGGRGRRREEGRWRSCVEAEDVKPSHNKTIKTKNKHTL